MKGLALRRKNKRKNKKSRLVEIEGVYEHPADKEVRPKLDSVVIIELEAAIQELHKELHRFDQNKPKVAQKNFLAAESYAFILKEVELQNTSVKTIDVKINEAKSYGDAEVIIRLLKEKQQILADTLEKVQPSMITIDQLEKEAYPKQIDKERFFKDYNEIIEIVTQMYQDYKSIEVKACKDGIGFLMHERLKKIRGDVVVDVVKDHRTVCEQFKADPETITLSQFAKIINARNNLNFMIKEFQLVFSTFDAKVAFEAKSKEVARQASIIASAYTQLNELLKTHPNEVLTEQLKDILCHIDGSPKSVFKEQEFAVSINTPLSSDQILDSKAIEIKSAYQALITVIKEYKLSFDFKKNIKPIIDRAAVINALGYIPTLNLEKVHEAIDYVYEDLFLSDTDTDFSKLISLRTLSADLLLENQKINNFIDAWKIGFPEIDVLNNRSFIYNGKEYPIMSSVMDYVTARTKLVTALKDHNDLGEDYKLIVSKLITTKKALTQYVNEQERLEPQLKNIRILLEEIQSTIHSIPVKAVETIVFDNLEETDRQFLYQFIQLRIEIEGLKSSLSTTKIDMNNKLFDQCSIKYREYLKLYNDFKQEFNAVKDLEFIFKNILKTIERKISQLNPKDDPRIKILGAIKDTFKAQSHTIRTMGKFLAEAISSIDDDTKDRLRTISEHILKEQVAAVAEIKAIINDEEMKQLPISQFNPLIAWIVLLIRPYMSLNSEARVEHRFFSARIDIELEYSPSENSSLNP